MMGLLGLFVFLSFELPFVRDALGLLVTTFSSVAAGLGAFYATRRDKQTEREYEQRIDRIQSQADKEPRKSRFAWDIARTKLEEYFDRNLSQVKAVFWISVAIMVAGMGFIIYAITRSINSPDTLTPTYVAGVAGVITEFIGATFMLLYRSTMKQALDYMATLERINRVGMAVQILDSIQEQTEKDAEAKNLARSEIAKMLLAGMWGADMPGN
jgi:hypothetical protein